MTGTKFLERLNRVSRTGDGTYRCECPTHGGHSLSVKLLDDGRILLKCWAGCETESVLAALGMTFADLFEKSLGEFSPVRRNPWSTRDVHELIIRESLTVSVIASDLLDRRTIVENDWQRLAQAVNRLAQIAGAVRH